MTPCPQCQQQHTPLVQPPDDFPVWHTCPVCHSLVGYFFHGSPKPLLYYATAIPVAPMSDTPKVYSMELGSGNYAAQFGVREINGAVSSDITDGEESVENRGKTLDSPEVAPNIDTPK